MARWLALVALVVGTFVVGFNEENRSALFNLPGGHGIHATDLLGTLLIALGAAVFWVASRHPRR